VHGITKLYRIEKMLTQQGASPKARYQVRQSAAQVDLEKFNKWLDRTALRIPKQSALGKTAHYTINQWPSFIRYLDEGYLSIDNNRAERAIRPFVVGRNDGYSRKASEVHAVAVFYIA